MDRRTGRIVIASATCVEQRPLARFGGLKSVQAVVVPGVGIAAAQASVDWSGENRRLIHRLLGEGVHDAPCGRATRPCRRSGGRTR